VTPADIFQNLYGRRQPSAQSHLVFRYSKIVSSPLLKRFRPGLKQFCYGDCAQAAPEGRLIDAGNQTANMKSTVGKKARSITIST